MASANYDLDLTGKWLFHSGDFSKRPNLAGGEYHLSSKAGGALKHLEGFCEESAWQEVDIPHDWLTQLPVDETADATPGCKKRDVAWYKKLLTLPDEDIERVELIFDGVLGQCTVFVNGVEAVRNFSGYNRFFADIGDYLLPGSVNEIAVFVDARRHEGWWYEGAGIYRPLCLRFRESTRILKEDCFVRTCGDTVLANLRFTGCCKIKAVLHDPAGRQIAEKTLSGTGEAAFSMELDTPLRWSPEQPQLYSLTVTLEANGKQVDRTAFSVGFRDIQWIPDVGMTLNEKPYPVQGICAHQDHGGLGAAVCADIEEYRISRLKSLGANAYRCAHHAPSETLLDICDRLGMLVMVENRHFNVSEETMKQVDALVKLSRNHPCVFLYSLFNEEPWQNSLRGQRVAAKLRARVRALDDTRAVIGAQNGGLLSDENAAQVLDLIGINYCLSDYEGCHARSPQKLILGTENSPTFATRGVYQTDRTAQVFADNGMEYPADFSQPLWETMETVAKHPYAAGCFVWSGLDHRGEPNPFGYPSVSSHWGFLDSCGFDKNIANWLRSYYLAEPFVRFAAFSDLPAEGSQQVTVYTNCDFAQLFADGCSLGVKAAEHHMILWEAPANAGKLVVIAEKNGKEISATQCRPGKPTQLTVTDANPRGASGKVRILNVRVTDEQGTPVLSENGMLSVEGPVLAVSNGDPNGHHNDKANRIALFNGMAQVITPRKGPVTLTYEDLAPVTIQEV